MNNLRYVRGFERLPLEDQGNRTHCCKDEVVLDYSKKACAWYVRRESTLARMD